MGTPREKAHMVKNAVNRYYNEKKRSTWQMRGRTTRSGVGWKAENAEKIFQLKTKKKEIQKFEILQKKIVKHVIEVKREVVEKTVKMNNECNTRGVSSPVRHILQKKIEKNSERSMVA